MDKVEAALAIFSSLTVGVVGGCIAGFVVYEWRQRRKPKPAPVPVPPRVAGALAPNQPVSIDFTRPHDFHFSRGGWRLDTGEEPLVFRGCTLEGFTSALLDGSAARDESLVWHQTHHSSHDRWVVLRQPDGRRVYAPVQALVYVVECEPGRDGVRVASEG